jgi:hypothetical protein
MQTGYLLRVGSLLLSSIMGGMAMFCLYYAAQVPNYPFALHLFLDALKWGGAATAIVYFQGRYLDR